MREQCKGCIYDRLLSGSNEDGLKCCHYLLDTGHRRKIGKNGKCLSKKKAKAAKK